MKATNRRETARRLERRFALPVILAFATAHAFAADFSFSGNLTADDDQRSFLFTVAQPANVTVRTNSYGGGVDSNGNHVAPGGFDPTISVYDSSGNLIANNRDGGCANVAADAVTGNCWDAFLLLQLPAGNYQVVLTQSENVANGPTLADGFAYSGQGNFTGPGGFLDETDAQRNTAFSLDIKGVPAAQAQLLITQQAPPTGKVAAAYSYQFVATGGTQPHTWTVAAGTLPPGLTLSAGGLLGGTPSAFATYNFTLQVADAASPQMSASQAFQIPVAPQDLQIPATSLPTWVTNVAFSQPLSAIGGYPPYTWSLSSTGSVAGLTLSAAGVLAGTPPAAGVFTIPVQVSDSHGTSAPRQLAWQVNAPLLITSTAALPPGITGRTYTGFNFTAQGGASVSITWSLANGTSAPPGITLSSNGALQGTAPTKGSYTFQVQATDGVFPVLQTVSLAVYDSLTITTTSLPPGLPGQAYGPVPLAGSGGSGLYSWSATNLPPGFSISAAGLISGISTAGATYQVTVQLTDATASQNAQATLPLVIRYPALQISGNGGLPGVAQGSAISGSFAATGGKPPYIWTISGAPAWLAIDPATGTLHGAAMQAGVFGFSVTVTDSQLASATVTASLPVLGITTTSLPNAITQAPYSQNLSAAGGTPPYFWSATGVPQGLSLSAGGALSGAATTGGSTTIFATVTDSTGVAASAGISFTVLSAGPLTVLTTRLSNGKAGTFYTDSLSAGGGTPPYTWSIAGGALPAGLSLSASGAIVGSPAVPGISTFTAHVTDAVNGSAFSASLGITIDPLALSLNTTLPSGVVGSDYPQQLLSPTGGTAPYSFSIGSGNLPPGLTLVSGLIGGIPTAAGTFNFTLLVTDSAAAPVAFGLPLSIVIRPAQADIILSSGAVAFALTAPASALPDSANVTIRSSVVLQLLNYSVTVTPQVAWLDVKSAGLNTPGSMTIALNSTALALTASAVPYQTSVLVACIAPSPCAGTSQNISVSLTVTGGPPQLTLTNALISLVATTSIPAPAQSFGVQNKGGGTLKITSITAADNWITLSGIPSSVPAGPPVNVGIGINPTGLPTGYYRSTITVVSSAGTAVLPVTLQFSVAGSMNLSQSGAQYQTQAGSPAGNPNGSFAILVSGAPSIRWSATGVYGSGWLKPGPPGGVSTPDTPGIVNFSVDSAALAAGTYYDAIRVTSADVVDSPLDFTVVLNVAPTTVPQAPDPQPAGVVFLTSVGAASVPPQTVQVFVSSKSPVSYQASASTENGLPWLAVAPVTGNASSSAPAQTTVTVTPGTMPQGFYRGSVSYALSSAAVRTVNVTLNIASAAAPAAESLSASAKPLPAAVTCTPATLVPTQTGLVSNFAQPTAWPTPLSIRLVDNCGASVPNGAVSATFTNGDPPLALRAADIASGVYTGTWIPSRTAAQVTVSARATAAGFPAATAQITGQITPNSAPLLTPNGTLHVFAPLIGGALGPGNIVQIYGQNLSGQAAQASAIPLPTSLGGTSVIVGGVVAPLYYASPTQINAQIPFELDPRKTYQITVQANGALTNSDSIQLSDVSPGIAAFASGEIIAQHLDATLISDTSPARPGEIIVFYLAGLGSTDIPVLTGSGAPLDQLIHPQVTPKLTLNGVEVPVLFAGLTPGLVGLYQVNFKVPDDAPDGRLPLVVSQNGSGSNATSLPVKRP